MEAPPPLLPREVKYDCPPEVAKKANERAYYGNSDRLSGIGALIILVFAVGWLSTGGNVAAFKAFLTSVVIFVAITVAMVIRHRRALVKASAGPLRTLVIANEGFTFRSGGQVSITEWPEFREMRLFEDFVILLRYNQSQPIAVPVAALGEPLMKVIERKVLEHGGKVVTPKRRTGFARGAGRFLILLICGILLITFLLLFTFNTAEYGDTFDQSKMEDLVANVRKTPFRGTAEFHWGGHSSPRLLTGANAAGYQVWAQRGDDQKLTVVIVTQYRESAGATGFAYSDTKLTPDTDKEGRSVLPLPGPLDYQQDAPTLPAHWWKVVEETGRVTTWEWSHTYRW